jgi:hypothetical protein
MIINHINKFHCFIFFFSFHLTINKKHQKTVITTALFNSIKSEVYYWFQKVQKKSLRKIL